MKASAIEEQEGDAADVQYMIGIFKVYINGPNALDLTEKYWNPRNITPRRIRDMSTGFFRTGFLKMKDDAKIRMAMSRDWFEGEGLKTIKGRDESELPELMLTDAGRKAMAEGKFRPCEGMGRRHGCKDLYEKTAKAIKSLEQDIEKIEKATRKKEDWQEAVASMKQNVEVQKRIMEDCTWWPVAVMDLGT